MTTKKADPLPANTTLAEIVDRRLSEISPRKTRNEVAEEMGLTSPNFLTMLRKGKTKLAVNRSSDLAKALELDPKLVLGAVLRQYYDEDTIGMMVRLLRDSDSAAEHDLVLIAREYLSHPDRLSHSTREKLKEVFRDNRPAGR